MQRINLTLIQKNTENTNCTLANFVAFDRFSPFPRNSFNFTRLTNKTSSEERCCYRFFSHRWRSKRWHQANNNGSIGHCSSLSLNLRRQLRSRIAEVKDSPGQRNFRIRVTSPLLYTYVYLLHTVRFSCGAGVVPPPSIQQRKHKQTDLFCLLRVSSISREI